jgi:hypothetical protein
MAEIAAIILVIGLALSHWRYLEPTRTPPAPRPAEESCTFVI